MQKKHFLKTNFEFKSLESNDRFLYFKGYASTFGNEDRVGDIVVKGSFKNSLDRKSSVKVLWQHSMRDVIGKSLLMREDDRGLYVEGRISKRTDLGRNVSVLIEDEVINQMSIGYYVSKYEDKDGVRYLKEIDLFEFSFVTEPANEMATLTGFKDFDPARSLPIADRELAWESNAAVNRIRSFTNSNDAPSQDYKKYFMYFDGENPDLFGSYKLPFCDIIEGQAYIVPRAIYAIAGILNGARGGVEIPDIDRSKIESFINELYRRMADKFDDSNIESPLENNQQENDQEEMQFESLKNIESFLKEKGCSQREAKTLISKVKEFAAQRDVEPKTERDVQEDSTKIEQVKMELIQILNKLQ